MKKTKKKVSLEETTEKVTKYVVTNYRYGKPTGSVISENEIDDSRMRFLKKIMEK